MPKMPDYPDFKICYVCGVKLTKRNTYGFAEVACCKPCQSEISYCKQWRLKPLKEIRLGIIDLKRKLWVLEKMVQRKEIGHPKVTSWRAKKAK